MNILLIKENKGPYKINGLFFVTNRTLPIVTWKVCNKDRNFLNIILCFYCSHKILIISVIKTNNILYFKNVNNLVTVRLLICLSANELFQSFSDSRGCYVRYCKRKAAKAQGHAKNLRNVIEEGEYRITIVPFVPESSPEFSLQR